MANKPYTPTDIPGHGRWYLHEGNLVDGEPERFISVTNITDSLNKMGLPLWAAQGAVRLALENLPQLIRAMRRRPCTPDPNGRGCGVCPNCVLREMSGWSRRESEKAKQRGSELHEAASWWVLHGHWKILDPKIQPYLDSFRQFTEDYGLTPDSWELNEAVVLNREHGYAGTIDGVVNIQGSATWQAAQLVAQIAGWPNRTLRLAMDTKTREKLDDPRFYPEMALQLKAYMECPTWLDRTDWSEHPMPTLDGAFVVQVRPDGYKVQPAITDEHTWAAFLHYMHAHRWMLERGPRSVGVKSFPLPDEMQGTKAAATRVARAKKAAALAQETPTEASPVAAATPEPTTPARRTPARKTAPRKAAKPTAAPATTTTRSIEDSLRAVPPPEAPLTHDRLPGMGLHDEDIPF